MDAGPAVEERTGKDGLVVILEYKTTGDFHTVFLEDTEIGRIRGEGEGWKAIERCNYDRTAPSWTLGRHQFPSLKEAKIYISRHIRRCYPGLEEK